MLLSFWRKVRGTANLGTLGSHRVAALLQEATETEMLPVLIPKGTSRP